MMKRWMGTYAVPDPANVAELFAWGGAATRFHSAAEHRSWGPIEPLDRGAFASSCKRGLVFGCLGRCRCVAAKVAPKYW